jgi:glucokinase
MHVKGWESVDLCGEMRRAFQLPVVVENDANAGALGEHRYGAGRGARFMAYMTVSTGIGGGVILDNKLYRGAHGMAAEFGHMVFHSGPHAPTYAEGKPGALEALASGPAIEREARVWLSAKQMPIPAGFTAKNVFDAARAGETWALETLEKTTDPLARGVAAVMCAFDLERVVIGGGVSLAGDTLFVPLRKAVNKHLPHFLEGKLEVLPAALGDYSALMGAVAAALDAKQ